MVSGCSKDDAAQPATYTYTLKGYSDIETRTDFGTPDTNSIPFVWSAGDKIWVDGQQSSPLESGGGSSATFTVETTSELDNSATIYYNMTGLKAFANVPAEQDANNSLGLNGDFGYATVENGSFTLQHATAYLWFDVTRANRELEGATLESITIDAADATIAGTAQWNSSSFNAPRNGQSIITLTVDKELLTENEGVMAAAVVLPTTLSKLTLTYEFTVDGVTKYYEKVIKKSRTLESGHTYKIEVADLKASDLWKEMRILTFEGDYWDSMVDNKQMNGDILYGSDFSWYDTDNTELCHYALEGGAMMFWGGGHAISNYSEPYYSPGYLDEYLNKYYDSSELYGWEGWQFLQLMTPIGARSGDNFAVHFGYYDYNSNNNMCMTLPAIEFSDGEERIIDHMYVTNTNYALNQICYGVSREDDNGSGDQFGGSYGGISPDTYLKIVAYGYNEEEAGMDSGEDYLYNPADNKNVTKAEFYLVKDGEAVLDWQKWDLSVLGPVVKVKFNFEFSDDMGGDYGFTIPAYFAYDDMAVRVKK